MGTEILLPKSSGLQRNYGIDLLRIVSMLYVVMLHVLGLGGITKAAQMGSAQYYFSWFWEMWVYCAVNIFGLISGYVGYTSEKRPYRYENYIVLWLQVVMWGVMLTGFSYCINPVSFSVSGLLRKCLPITTNIYWYFTAYSALFFVIPFLNRALQNSSRESLFRLSVFLVTFFSVYSTLGDRWRLVRGFSFLWLVVLYILGASMKKCGFLERVSQKTVCFGIIVCTLISWLCKLFENKYGLLLGNSLVEETYLTPTHLISAMLHLRLFSKLQLRSWLTKLVKFAAPGAFAVYLLNCHDVVMNGMLVDKFAQFSGESLVLLTLRVMGFSIAFVVASILLDYFRQLLFKWLNIKEMARRITGIVERILNYMIKKWMD